MDVDKRKDVDQLPNALYRGVSLLEYGNASDPAQFEYLSAYSPYQKVTPGKKYPAVLFTTGDQDTRVPPLQARKMTARLQACERVGQACFVALRHQGGPRRWADVK